MSLYNNLFGENQDANVLIGVLGLNKELFGRFRDIYLNVEGTEITVYTRCGGNNRTEYDRVFEIMKRHPNYITDWDDLYDNTYAYIKFSVPEKYKKLCKKIAPKESPLNVSEKFEKEMKEMNDPNSKAFNKAENLINQLIDQINDNYENYRK